jgi:GT2 family glycosyltransferase
MGEWHTIAVHEATITRSWPPTWLGGGSARDLMMFQLPAHMRHAARPVTPDCFPKRSDSRPRPVFAIVTPTYRHVSSLEETIHSVLNQPEVQCNYVVQDGGSTDGSVEIIRSHEGRLHAWESIADHGQADAIARGFAKTSGGPDDLMAWINSDDFYLRGALSYVADYFARHPDVAVVYGHRILVDEHSHEIGRWYLPKHDPDILRLNDFVPQETLFWRRRIWDKVGGIDTSFQFAMDWDLLLRFQEAGAKIVRLPYFLACFRVHAQQKTSALISTQGQAEIDALRQRTFGRNITPDDLLLSKPLQRYLRRSAWIEQLWKWGIRAR